jgi:LAO/AO transport system kinase
MTAPDTLPPQDAALVTGLLAHERRALAKTITLIESSRADHQQRAQAVLEALMPHTGKSLRIGISGVPGVGKSTFIEAFGLQLIAHGHRVAVLAVDPSSSITGGSHPSLARARRPRRRGAQNPRSLARLRSGRP